MSPSPDHLPILGIQAPPLLSTVFCQPVAIGGPGGLGLSFPAWPILVPAREGIQVCYTRDEHFRDTYMEKGFCGLDASFRSQFDHHCPGQIVQVVPTVLEQQQNSDADQGNGAHQGQEPSNQDQREQSQLEQGQREQDQREQGQHEAQPIQDQQDANGDDRHELTLWRWLMTPLHRTRGFVESFDGDFATIVKMLVYLTILCSIFKADSQQHPATKAKTGAPSPSAAASTTGNSTLGVHPSSTDAKDDTPNQAAPKGDFEKPGSMNTPPANTGLRERSIHNRVVKPGSSHEHGLLHNEFPELDTPDYGMGSTTPTSATSQGSTNWCDYPVQVCARSPSTTVP